MVRSLTLRASLTLWRVSLWMHARAFTIESYPTRSGESLSSWVVLVWSMSLCFHPEMFNGAHYAPMSKFASAEVWGRVGVILSTLSLVALIANGHWKPSPDLRAVGAIYRAMFWSALAYCYYVSVVLNGAPDFPLRRAFYILIIFEMYACLWCGHESHVQSLKYKARQSGLTVRAGNG